MEEDEDYEPDEEGNTHNYNHLMKTNSLLLLTNMCGIEIKMYAEMLGMNIEEDPDLMWIVLEGVSEPTYLSTFEPTYEPMNRLNKHVCVFR